MTYHFLKVLLWHGRYRITDQRPEYESPTTTVYRAVDEHTLDQHNQPTRVVLKLTHSEHKYRREVRARGYLGGALDEDYVVPHIRLHHHSAYEPLLTMSPAAAATATDNVNDDASSCVDGNNIIDNDSVVPLPRSLPGTPVGRGVPCTGSGEGECAVLAELKRKTAKHWLTQRIGTRARARGAGQKSSSLTHSNDNGHTDIDFDDDGWSQVEEGSDETAPSQIAQSNLTAPNQETDTETEKRGSSRGGSGAASRGSSRGGSGGASRGSSGSGLILSKRIAQKMLMIVMPQADRNLFTALKHEHSLVRQQQQQQQQQQLMPTANPGLHMGSGLGMGLGVDSKGNKGRARAGAEAVCLSKVRAIFTQLLDATAHMHDKGYLHGDLCPMNIGRSVSQSVSLYPDLTLPNT